MLSPVIKKETPEMTTGFFFQSGSWLSSCRQSKETIFDKCQMFKKAYPEDLIFIFTVREKPLEHQGSFFGWTS